MRARTVSGRRGYMYASSTAGLFYFMNRNISRDNWTRGARPPLNCLHTAVCLPRVPHIVPCIRRTHHHHQPPRRVASRRIVSRRHRRVATTSTRMAHTRPIGQCESLKDSRIRMSLRCTSGPNLIHVKNL